MKKAQGQKYNLAYQAVSAVVFIVEVVKSKHLNDLLQIGFLLLNAGYQYQPFHN